MWQLGAQILQALGLCSNPNSFVIFSCVITESYIIPLWLSYLFCKTRIILNLSDGWMNYSNMCLNNAWHKVIFLFLSIYLSLSLAKKLEVSKLQIVVDKYFCLLFYLIWNTLTKQPWILFTPFSSNQNVGLGKEQWNPWLVPWMIMIPLIMIFLELMRVFVSLEGDWNSKNHDGSLILYLSPSFSSQLKTSPNSIS